MSNRIEVLIGMIASGKSTYALKRAKEGAIVINDDSIVLAVHSNNYTLYNETLKPIYKAIANNIIHMGISMGYDIIIDNTNLKSDTRKRWVSIAKSLDVPIYAVFFPRYLVDTHAKRRYKADSRGLSYNTWKKVAEQHAKNYPDHVLCGEGFTGKIEINNKGEIYS